jgi:glycosyltransferase involved in cell wall biosynthesis
LDALIRAASSAGWQQAAVAAIPESDPEPDVGGLDPSAVRLLKFESKQLPFAMPGMSDVMPYPSTRFSALTDDQLRNYRSAWRNHVEGVISEFQPDVIHSHHIWLLSSMLKDLTPETPVVTHCHATGLRQIELCPHLADEVRQGCRRNDRFIVLHTGHRDSLVEQLQVSADRIHIVRNGYRPDIFHTEGRLEVCGPEIVYAGKLSRAKGLPWLLDAAERLAIDIPGFRLHVAGSGAGREADEIRVRMGGIPAVTYHGQIAPPELADLMRRSAVFVLPSFYEGLPLVLVEAAACGCRLVSTALPGVVDQLAAELDECLTTVPLPRLIGADCPVDADLSAFTDALRGAIVSAVSRPPLQVPVAGLRGLSWNGVFGRIETVWRELL